MAARRRRPLARRARCRPPPPTPRRPSPGAPTGGSAPVFSLLPHKEVEEGSDDDRGPRPTRHARSGLRKPPNGPRGPPCALEIWTSTITFKGHNCAAGGGPSAHQDAGGAAPAPQAAEGLGRPLARPQPTRLAQARPAAYFCAKRQGGHPPKPMCLLDVSPMCPPARKHMLHVCFGYARVFAMSKAQGCANSTTPRDMDPSAPPGLSDGALVGQRRNQGGPQEVPLPLGTPGTSCAGTE